MSNILSCFLPEGACKKKGFVFSIEAVLALLLFLLMLSALPQQKPASLKELALTQEANDLLRVWSAKETNEQEMAADANALFGERFELFVNKKKIYSGTKSKNSIATEALILGQGLDERDVTIKAYYD